MQTIDIWQHPDRTSDTFYDMLESETKKDGWKSISLQFKNLINIGFDYSVEYPEVFEDIDLMYDLVNYVHDNYLSIQEIHLIIGDEFRTKIIGKLLYQFLIIDFPLIILPKVIKDNDISLDDISHFPLRDAVIKYIINKVNNINRVLSIKSTYEEMKKDRYKNLFYLQIMDNDLDDFVNNFVIPVIEQNYSVIYAAV